MFSCFFFIFISLIFIKCTLSHRLQSSFLKCCCCCFQPHPHIHIVASYTHIDFKCLFPQNKNDILKCYFMITYLWYFLYFLPFYRPSELLAILFVSRFGIECGCAMCPFRLWLLMMPNNNAFFYTINVIFLFLFFFLFCFLFLCANSFLSPVRCAHTASFCSILTICLFNMRPL